MSASMLRQMLEDAGAQLKERKFQEALDGSRRVTQFDPTNFQAFLCVGLASLHLQQWEECEEAFRRAANLKPAMPAPWKNLVDLFEESKQPQKKLEPLEKLVTIFRETNKVKACQKWIAEVAAIATELKMFPKAFDAWYSLVVAQSDDTRATCLAVTPNEELSSPMVIWLDLVDLLQRPNFNLSDCATPVTTVEVAEQFFLAASTWSPDAVADATARLDSAVAFFLRASLDELKATKVAKKKSALLHKLDAQALGVIEWLPTSKIAAEFLLLRSEDSDSPITLERASRLALELQTVYAKSPMVQVFNGLRLLEANETEQAQATILDALAYCSSSSFFESALCVRAQMELATLLLSARDVEGCLSRLQRAKSLIAEKSLAFGSAPPHAAIYSETKAQLMEASAWEHSGDSDKALAAYQTLINTADDDPSAGYQATIRISELLLAKSKFIDTRATLESFTQSGSQSEGDCAVLSAIRGWVQFQLGFVDEAKTLLESAVPKIPVSSGPDKARALKRLAVVYWHLGGAYRQEKAFCFGLLLQAAKLSPADSEIFGWLGKWYEEVVRDTVRAEKCFLKALSLSPSNEIAGVALSDLYERQQQSTLNVKLWEDMTQESVSAPTWALLRLAQHLVELDDERAVGKLHLVLRNDPFNARHWVAMGHVYRHFGKIVSAHKSYLKAVELGETNWCLMCELGRIEGELLLFEEAFTHIEPFLPGSSAAPPDSEQASVVSMLYAELLFKQAKHLCAEGLFGRASENVLKASRLMQSLPSSGLCGTADGLKLIGDIHSLAFYLSPSHFDHASAAPSTEMASAWVDFISSGRKAFEAMTALLSASSDDVPASKRAEAFYNVGLSCWYEAQALCTVHGISFSGFEHMQSPQTLEFVTSIKTHEPQVFARVEELKAKAKKSFEDSVKANPQLVLGWNGLGVVHDHVIVKQFAWIRATQVGRNDAPWANLGMLYVQHPEGGAAASLARKALVHLQGVSASNPAMWNGYAMLARRERSAAEQQKAIESFRCALEMGLDMDALQGFAASSLAGKPSGEFSRGEKHDNYEELLFAMRKVMERDPFNTGSWTTLGVLQQRLGLFKDACASFARAQSLLAKTPWYNQTADLKWSGRVAAFGCEDSALDFEKAITEAEAQGTSSSVLVRLLKAQQLHHRSDGTGSLQAIVALLQSDLTDDERDIVAAVGLAIAGLLKDDKRVSEGDVDALRVLCKEHLLRDLAGGISDTKLRVVELHDRAAGLNSDVQSFLEMASTGDKPPASVWSRLAFALIDFQQVQSSALLSQALSSARKHADDDTRDVTYLRVLADVLLPQPSSTGATKSDYDGRSAQKLVRMQPWDPYAYFLAGAALLKSYALTSDSKDEESRRRRQHTLRSATLLLENGLKVTTSFAQHNLERVLIQWMLSLCYTELGDATRASSCVSDAQASIDAVVHEFPSRALDCDLLSARLQSVVSPLEGAKKYQAVLSRVASSSSSERLAPILSELGAVYEDAGYLDCALQVWKAVTSLTTASGSDDRPAAAGSFLANLRLAIIHGKKQNAKTAKKQIKATIALAPSPESAQATVAAFVESVIAKSS